jgi:hypothetical protein
MVNPRHRDALSVAPPVDARISATFALQQFSLAKPEHFVECRNLRLVRYLKEHMILLRVGTPSSAAVTHNYTVCILDSRLETEFKAIPKKPVVK